MSACLCHVPPTRMPSIQASASAMAKLSMNLHPGTLAKLEAAAAMTETANVNVADLLGLEKAASTVPASFNAKLTGALMQLSMMIQMVPGNFSLFDPIKLKKELKVMEEAVNSRAPSISAMAGINAAAMVKVAMVARLVAKMKLNGLDPEDPNAASIAAAKASLATKMSASMPRFNIANLPKVQLIAALPTLVEEMEKMKIPVGDPVAAPAMMSAMFKPLLALQAPALQIKLAAILNAAAVIEAKETIEETFGEGAATNGPLLAYKINMAMKLAASLTLPPVAIPIELPTPEQIKLGEAAAAKSGILKAGMSGFALPKLNFMPSINAFLALRGALKIPPYSFCTICGA